MNITIENIKTAISNATIDGNFNSDLIENSRLRKLAVNHYAKQIVKSNPDSVLKDYVDTSTNVIGYSEPDSAPAKTQQVFNKFIDIGGKTALVVEQTSDYILGKFANPTFSDKAYFTVGYVTNNGISDYFSGHYDMNLIDATNDFIKRNQ